MDDTHVYCAGCMREVFKDHKCKYLSGSTKMYPILNTPKKENMNVRLNKIESKLDNIEYLLKRLLEER